MRLLLAPALAFAVTAAASLPSPAAVPDPRQPPADSQPPSTITLRGAGARACDLAERIVALRVERADGSAVNDAVVVARDARTGRVVRRVERGFADGQYLLFGGDADPAVLGRDGAARYALEVRGRDARGRAVVRRARLVLGRDPTGCHVVRTGGPAAVRL